MTKLEPTRTSSDLTATDIFRAMLDERGVEWEDMSVRPYACTSWCDSNGEPCTALEGADDIPGGRLSVQALLTPEQAIAATLGPGTCKQEEHGWSTEGDHARVWLTCGHDCMVETVADLPNFCPTCGAKVVDA